MASMIAKLWTRLCSKRVPLSIMLVGLDNSGKTSILNSLASVNLDSGHLGHKTNTSSRDDNSTQSTDTDVFSSTKLERGQTTGKGLTSGNIMPTVGYNFERIQYKNITITVLDFSGQNRYRNLWQEFYNSIDAIVFVIDSSDLISLSVPDGTLSGTSSSAETQQKQLTVCQGKLVQSPLEDYSSLSPLTTSLKRMAPASLHQLQANKSGAQSVRRRTKVPILFLANKTDLASSVDTEVICKALNLSQVPIERHPWFVQATSVKLNQGIVEGFDWLVSQLSA